MLSPQFPRSPFLSSLLGAACRTQSPGSVAFCFTCEGALPTLVNTGSLQFCNQQQSGSCTKKHRAQRGRRCVAIVWASSWHTFLAAAARSWLLPHTQALILLQLQPVRLDALLGDDQYLHIIPLQQAATRLAHQSCCYHSLAGPPLLHRLAPRPHNACYYPRTLPSTQSTRQQREGAPCRCRARRLTQRRPSPGPPPAPAAASSARAAGQRQAWEGFGEQ